MNNLDLNAMGVSEMNEVEMKRADGGNWAVLSAFIFVYDAVSYAVKGFGAGYDAGYNQR